MSYWKEIDAILKDEYGTEAENTLLNELRIAEATRLVGANFDGATLDANFWTGAASGVGASIAQAGSQVVLTSGTGAAGTVTLYSKRRARYVSGVGIGYRAVIQLGDTGIANNKRRWGVGFGASMPTVTDGAWFQLSGTTFSIATQNANYNSGNPVVVDSGSFNGEVASFAPSTNAATFEIYWTNGKVVFSINGVLIHTVSASANPWAGTMNHYVFADNINSGNTTSVTLSMRVASIRRFGPLTTQPTSYYHANGQTAGAVLKYGPGNLHGIVIGQATNNAVITLYDNTAASGTILYTFAIGTGFVVPTSIDLFDIPFFLGLTLVVATQNASCTIAYE